MIKNWKKDTALFLTSQTLSMLGTSLVQYAILWYITLETQSGVMMTISIICGFLPTFFLAPFAGVWADRFDRKKLIIIADSMIALTTLLMAILFWMGYSAMWQLFVLSAFRAIGSAIQGPAVGSFLPQFVPEDKLMRVNGINTSIQSMIMLISPMLAGALMTMAPLESIFMIDVATAILAVLVLMILKVAPHAKALEKATVSYFSDLKAGIHYIKNHGYIRRFFIFVAFFNFFITPVAFLSPLQVARSFGNDVWRLTAIEITFSMGMLMGGVVMSIWGGFKNRVYTMTLSSFATGIAVFALGVVSNFWVYISIMGVAGVFMPLFSTPSTVLIQEKVEEAFMGRVFGVMSMIYSSVMPLAMLIFGPLSDFIKIEWLLIVTGTLIFVQSFFLIGNKVLVLAGEPIEAEST